MLMEHVFARIRLHIPYPVLVKPEQSDLSLYAKDTTVVILPLTSEIPIISSTIPTAKLEKILVDLFANRLLENILGTGEFSRIYGETMLFQYARRRNAEEKILAFVKSNITISLWIEEHP